jgi:succinoglycan biosynthesis transport protein ExoP
MGQMGEIGSYIRAIKSRLWLVALLIIIAVGAAYWVIGRRSAGYTAQVTLMLRGPVVSQQPVLAVADTGFAERQDVVANDVIVLIDSRPIAERVAKRLNMPPGPGTIAAIQRAVSGEAVRNGPGAPTSLVHVNATAQSPQRAADLANAISDEFVGYFHETNREAVTEARRFVEGQLAQARTRLEASERALQAFRENRRILSVTDASTRAATAFTSIQTELDAAVRSRQETEARFAAARQRLAQERPLIVASRATTENPAFRQIQTHLVDLEIRRAALAQQYTPQHPRMDEINREIADVRDRLLKEAQTMVGDEVTTSNPLHARLLGDILTMEVERAALSARIDALQSDQRRRQADLMTIPSTETEFNRLSRENRILESNYTTLATRYQEILLRENEAGFSPASLQIIETAIPPTTANTSAFPRAAAAAGLAGLVMGVVAALLLDALDDRLRNAQDAERALGVPVLAQIPTQGQLRTAPAPAVFAIGILLAVVMATAAIARGYVPVPGPAGDGVRAVVSTVTSWIGGARSADSQTQTVVEGH